MPEFRYIQFTNSLPPGVNAPIFPTITLEDTTISASDTPTPQGSTVTYDLAPLTADAGGELHNVAIGTFVAAAGGLQAKSGMFMTITNQGNIHGYFAVTGTADKPYVEFNGYGDAK